MKRILIIRLSHLGDIILTEPVMRSIKQALPDSQIDFLTRSVYREAVELFDGVDSILTLEIPGRDQSLSGLTKTINRLCKNRYDLVLDLHGNLRSWWIKFQLKTSKTKTYRKNWWARRQAVKRKIHSAKTHTLDLYMSALNGTDIPAIKGRPQLSVSDESSGSCLTDLGLERGGHCVFAVGASHPTKHYPIPQWVKLAERVNAEMGFTVVIVEKERVGYLNLFDELVESKKSRVVTGLPLADLAALLSQARFTISNDSGVMHLSSAVGAPTLGLFGPTHPSLGFSPLGDRCTAITTNEKCSPCSKHGAKPCYRDERYCFTKMTADLILRHIREVIPDE